MSEFQTTTPFVSVIVVNYNYASLLLRALNALKEQTFQNFEIVLVNNGSTDDSQDVIDAFIKDNPQLKIVPVLIKTNTGLRRGRNEGIKAATGEYLLFNDADDWMDTNCLSELCALAQKENADKVCGAFKEIDTKGKCLRVCDFCEDQSKWFTVSLQATLFQRAIIQQHDLFFHETWLDDIDYNTHFNYHAKKVCFWGF